MQIEGALERNELVLYYQPKVDMRTGCVLGAEALIRWNHPERGVLGPGAFLPHIEDSDLIVKVGAWVLEEALRQMAEWHRSGLHLPVSVNVAPRQLQTPDFCERLAQLIASHPELPRDILQLEVLESTALDDMKRIGEIIQQCRELGVTVALDDFGTGYSTLTYLKRIPADQLKIDKSFVGDMLGDPEARAIVEAVIGLAEAFKRTVIAEGAETPEHCAMLLRMGCDVAQGYGIAKPMPSADLPGWVEAFKPHPLWATPFPAIA
jgi:EAL domain-containing protein (putative c-di-GMP-specific phosphodiesterase class I)